MTNNSWGRGRIGITHTGRVPRDLLLVDRIMAKAAPDHDPQAHRSGILRAVEACVRHQHESGLGIVADGEERSGFALYVQDRISGLEPRPGSAFHGFRKKHGLFLENFEPWLRNAVRNGAIVTRIPMTCTGPVEYTGHEEIRLDVQDLAAAAAEGDCSGAFMVSIAPGAIEHNDFYSSLPLFHEAMVLAMRTEYKAITDAGFFLQIDDPYLPRLFSDTSLERAETHRRACDYVNILNHALSGLPEDRIRYRIFGETAKTTRTLNKRFPEIAMHMLNVNACAYLFEAQETHYEEDAHLWQSLHFPAGKILVPSIVNWMRPESENPEVLAERIVRFANRVGRDGIIPCAENRGLTLGHSQSDSNNSNAIWAKMAALNDGAQRASQRLWHSQSKHPATASTVAA